MTRLSMAQSDYQITRLPNYPISTRFLSDFDQLLDRRRRRRRGVEPPDGFAAGGFEQLAVANQIDHPERRHAGLTRAEEVARSTQPQIAFRDLEPVGRLGHRLQPLARVVGQRLEQQKAERLVPIAADPAAQLVELRQT